MTHHYKSLEPAELELPQMHAYLLSAVAPRPIALASTVDANGKPNLAPFSYFNVFSTRPPILIVSPNRSGQTGEQKHTALNAIETQEMVINIVNYSIVEQMNIASCAYPVGVNEFEKSGLTPLASDMVQPLRVAESPVQLECVVREVIETGNEGGSGTLIFCEIVKMHINESVLSSEGNIDTKKMDLVARMGGNWYCRAGGDALFEVKKPIGKQLLGIDNIPAEIRHSEILTGNDLGKLANIERLPSQEKIDVYVAKHAESLKNLNTKEEYDAEAKKLLAKNAVEEAWLLLMSAIA